MVNGTELGDQEWRYYLFLCYVIDPPDLPPYCDGYNAAFFIYHKLYCNKGSLITTCNNHICDGVANFSGKALTPSHVSNETLIHPVRALQEGKSQTTVSPPKTSTASKETSKQKEDLLIH